MIRLSEPDDMAVIYEIINDSAQPYKGIIPADRWQEPYMTRQELAEQIEDGVMFWCYQDKSTITGVMGIQSKGDVTLIRHAYVRSNHRNSGVGGQLLSHLCQRVTTPVLIGTWAAASWAIKFYQKHGFSLLVGDEKDKLLRKYWRIPQRQVETSVVLTNVA
jgi:N-acetylglutamate synthase-like GNAT family acetyltransferase